MEQKPWIRTADWHDPCSLFILLSYTTQDNLPRDGFTPNELSPYYQDINQDNTITGQSDVEAVSVVVHFSQIYDFTLCQVDTKLSRTTLISFFSYFFLPRNLRHF